jgi:hypothetical protein
MPKHPLEDPISYTGHISRHPNDEISPSHRSLRHHHDADVDAIRLETEAHQADEREAAKKEKMEQKLTAKADKKRRKRYAELFRSSGIGKESVHGIMVRLRSSVVICCC